MAEAWSMGGYPMQSCYQATALQKPKVGFGVVCRCPGRLEKLCVYTHACTCMYYIATCIVVYVEFIYT